MTIKLFARPYPQWTIPGDWSQVTVEGDDEEVIATVIVAHLLMTRHEVMTEVDSDPLEPPEDDDEAT
jgi:hypothetical protein